MIGNDIVDLHLATKQSNWRHPRFLEKLFTEYEQDLVLNARHYFSSIWQLWAMKEAAYKAYVQMHPSRFFDPKGFVCSALTPCAEVNYKDFKIEVRTTINHKFVFSETSSEDHTDTQFIEFKSDNSIVQGLELRKAVFLKMSDALGLNSNELHLVKDVNGVPQVYCNSSRINVALSLTHHGVFGAYSIVYL